MDEETLNNEETQNSDERLNSQQLDDSFTTEDEEVIGNLAEFEQFDESSIRTGSSDSRYDYLNDLQLNVYIELGRTQMKIKDILELERGYVIELDKLASEPVDIYVNNKKIAEGEVVVIDKHFGIRIVNLIDNKDKLQGLA